MNDDDDDFVLDEDSDAHDVSAGKNADSEDVVKQAFSKELYLKYEIFSYRNAAPILAQSFPVQFKSLVKGLEAFKITKKMIRMPGGSKGPIAHYADTLFDEKQGWVETRITADLQVKLLHSKRPKTILKEYVREGYLDGHRIDFLNGRVALDFEWNSKDQTYDRDLYAFSAFYDAGAIDLGVIITRGSSLDANFFRSLGSVLKKDGITEGDEATAKKFGASTTWMGKLLYRLDAGRNGGCPILAIGITPKCID